MATPLVRYSNQRNSRPPSRPSTSRYVSPEGEPCSYEAWQSFRIANPPQHIKLHCLTIIVKYVGVWIPDGTQPLPWHMENALGTTLFGQYRTEAEALVGRARLIEQRRVALNLWHVAYKAEKAKKRASAISAEALSDAPPQSDVLKNFVF